MTPSNECEIPRAVLLVEDDEACRLSVTALLRIQGFDVIAVEDGQTAIETYRIRRSEVGVVLLDVVLPGLSGHQTFVELRRLKRDLPIVLTSGYEEQRACRDFASGDYEEFIPKTAPPGKLQGTLRQFIETLSTDQR